MAQWAHCKPARWPEPHKPGWQLLIASQWADVSPHHPYWLQQKEPHGYKVAQDALVGDSTPHSVASARVAAHASSANVGRRCGIGSSSWACCVFLEKKNVLLLGLHCRCGFRFVVIQ